MCTIFPENMCFMCVNSGVEKRRHPVLIVLFLSLSFRWEQVLNVGHGAYRENLHWNLVTRSVRIILIPSLSNDTAVFKIVWSWKFRDLHPVPFHPFFQTPRYGLQRKLQKWTSYVSLCYSSNFSLLCFDWLFFWLLVVPGSIWNRSKTFLRSPKGSLLSHTRGTDFSH